MHLHKRRLSEFNKSLLPTQREYNTPQEKPYCHLLAQLPRAPNDIYKDKHFDLTSNDRYQANELEAAYEADVYTSVAKAEGSERPTDAQTATMGSASGASAS